MRRKADANPEARRRAEVILETIAGRKTVKEAAAELRISETRFEVIRKAAIEGMAEAISPKMRGRKPKGGMDEKDEEIAVLRERNKEILKLMKIAEVRELLALTMPEVLLRRKPKKKKRPKGESS